MNPHLLPKVRSKTLRNACAKMPCTLRVASFGGMQCAPEDTVVDCHITAHGKGTGTKETDLSIAAGCSLCHALVDRDDPRGMKLAELYPGAWNDRLRRAVMETQAHWVKMGLLRFPDDVEIIL